MNANSRARTPVRAGPQAIPPDARCQLLQMGDIGRKPMRLRAKNAKYAPPDLVNSIRTQFWVFPRTPQPGQYASASSSLGVSRELHLALFPQGLSRRGLARKSEM